VQDVGFEVAAGECYGLLGPNGAGKTTTISMICGLLVRDGGNVTVAGLPMEARSVKARTAIGYVPQDIALYPELSAAENLRFFGRLYGLAGRTLADRVGEALTTVGLADRAGEPVDQFSGGMKRRANIAAGLLHRPRLLVLDEPTVGVDPQSRHSILETVAALTAGGMAVLYTTHYMEEAERLCDRVGIIDEGRLVAEGTRRELVAKVGITDQVRVVAVASAADLGRLAAACKDIAGIVGADADNDGVTLVAADARHLLRPVIEQADRIGVDISSVEVVEPDLEAVFLALTGKELRD
jgi:ABC-2 type transport system ATP-binding protein